MKNIREVLRAKKTHQLSTEDTLKAICIDLSKDVSADLVSIWFFDEDLTMMECQAHYDATSETFKKGQVIERSQYPTYFQAIIEETYVSAPDSQNQLFTRELAKDYLIPNNIKSILDFILHEDLAPVGVICCENRNETRNWSEADKRHLRIVATLISHRFDFKMKDSA